MSLNALIAQGPRPIQIEDPVNQLAKVMQIQGAQQNQQLGRMKMDEYERGLADENQMRDLTRQAGGNVSKLRELAYGAGNYKQGLALDKTINEQKTATLKYDADTFKLANDRYSTSRQRIGALAYRPDLTRDMVIAEGQSQVQAGLLPRALFEASISRMPEDPERLRAELKQGLASELPAAEIVKLFAPKAEKIDNGASISFRDTNPNSPTFGQQTGGAPIAKVQSPESIASQATARRGQDMVDARSRESTAATLTKPFEVTGEDGKPVLVQQDKAGNIRPVQGYLPKQGASKPLTEGQAKAALFGSRMQAAEGIFGELADKGVTTSIPGSRTGYGVGAAINALQPGERQRLDQAKRDFINAVLRRESGAVISQQEFDNAELQYFPQPGETPEQKAQKKANRELATRGILAEVPDADNRVAKIRGARPPEGPAIGTVQDGYKFKGGNPSDPKSWEKV